MKALAFTWFVFTIGLGVVLIQQHAKDWVVMVTFLFTIPISAWSAAFWWSR